MGPQPPAPMTFVTRGQSSTPCSYASHRSHTSRSNNAGARGVVDSGYFEGRISMSVTRSGGVLGGYADDNEDDDGDSGCQTAVIGGGPALGPGFDMFSKEGPAPHTQSTRVNDNSISGTQPWSASLTTTLPARHATVETVTLGTPVSGGLCQLFGASRLETPRPREGHDDLSTPPSTPTATPMPQPLSRNDPWLDLLEAQTPMPGLDRRSFGTAAALATASGATTRTSVYLSVDLSQNRLYQKRMQRQERQRTSQSC
eukprot:m.38208 g.38208  ORF g.38208 m.38208 type:complete len:257 (+) comp5623_c0_seq1:466-1236(+)